MKHHSYKASIVVIGAGPAGIATAIEARKLGYEKDQIIILEKSSEIMHMIAEKYPEEKMVLANYKGIEAADEGGLHIPDMTKQEFIDFMQNQVRTYDLDIRFNQTVTKIVKLHNGQFLITTQMTEFLGDAVFVAIGNMSSPKSLGIHLDEESSKAIHYDLRKITIDMKQVLVIGGGDSAAEYARILTERGHEVTLSYRGKEFVRMIQTNAQITKKLIAERRIKFLPESEVSHISNSGESLTVRFKDNKYSAAYFDVIVAAIGTDRPHSYLRSLGIDEHDMDGLYFLGDLNSGHNGGSINLAFNSAVNAFKDARFYHLS